MTKAEAALLARSPITQLEPPDPSRRLRERKRVPPQTRRSPGSSPERRRHIPPPKAAKPGDATAPPTLDAAALAGYYDTFASRSKLGRTPISSLFAAQDEFANDPADVVNMPQKPLHSFKSGGASRKAL